MAYSKKTAWNEGRKQGQETTNGLPISSQNIEVSQSLDPASICSEPGCKKKVGSVQASRNVPFCAFCESINFERRASVIAGQQIAADVAAGKLGAKIPFTSRLTSSQLKTH